MYDADLAWIQHHGFGDFARGAAPGILDELAAAGLAGGRVVDLGCGSGVLLRELARAGYDAVGVDVSPALLALARETAPDAELVQGSAWEVELPPCVAVTAVGEVLSYLPDGEAGAPELGALFGRVANALVPGGLFLFDILVTGGGEPMVYRTRREGEGWTVEVEVDEDVPSATLQRRIVTSRLFSGRWRQGEEVHRLRVLQPERLTERLEAAGFAVATSEAYGRFGLAQRRLAVRAQTAPPNALLGPERPD